MAANNRVVLLSVSSGSVSCWKLGIGCWLLLILLDSLELLNACVARTEAEHGLKGHHLLLHTETAGSLVRLFSHLRPALRKIAILLHL